MDFQWGGETKSRSIPPFEKVSSEELPELPLVDDLLLRRLLLAVPADEAAAGGELLLLRQRAAAAAAEEAAVRLRLLLEEVLLPVPRGVRQLLPTLLVRLHLLVPHLHLRMSHSQVQVQPRVLLRPSVLSSVLVMSEELRFHFFCFFGFILYACYIC